MAWKHRSWMMVSRIDLMQGGLEMDLLTLLVKLMAKVVKAHIYMYIKLKYNIVNLLKQNLLFKVVQIKN